MIEVNKLLNRKFVTLILLFAIMPLACNTNEDHEKLDKIVFMAGYKAQANLPFVAAYVAKENGYFIEQGLDVEIRHATGGLHTKLLLSGDIQFTTAAAASVLKRRSDQELPLLAIALFGQRGQQSYIALKNSGIQTVNDWEGKTFGYKISPPPDYVAMLQANGVDRSTITEVNAGFDPRVLTEGKVDILAVFKSNEPDTIRKLGFDINEWEPEDYGAPMLGLTYIVLEEFAESNPETVTRFLNATMKATEFSELNPEKTLEIVMKYAPDESIEHQDFMLKTELSDAVSPLTKEHGFGWMTSTQWKNLYEFLLKYEALPNPFDYESAYDISFLTTVYENFEREWP